MDSFLGGEWRHIIKTYLYTQTASKIPQNNFTKIKLAQIKILSLPQIFQNSLKT